MHPMWGYHHRSCRRFLDASLERAGSLSWLALADGKADFKTAMLAEVSFQVLLQYLRGLVQRVAHRGHLADRAEETVIVNQVFVAHYRDVHAGEIQVERVSHA